MRRSLLIILLNVLFIAALQSQTLLSREAMNNFAEYSSTGNIKKLEAARKNIDDSYKTRADSNSFRINLIRGLVYASLARVDSNLKYTYKKDPVEEVKSAMRRVYGSRFEDDSQHHIRYIEEQLKRTYLWRANTAFRSRRFPDALKNYAILDSLEKNNLQIIHNLAILNQELGFSKKASEYYELLIASEPRPEYFLALSNIYETIGDESSVISILKGGSDAFPNNRDIVYKLLNILGSRNDYKEIIKFTERALMLDQQNINLLYMAGFAEEMTGNYKAAEKYYKDILNINPDNYEGNYALGLLYLNLYLKDETLNDELSDARYHLAKANEIDPYELKSLTSLSVLYKYTDDQQELKKVKNRINQLKLN